MAKKTSPADVSLNAEERVILFIVASRIHHASVGIVARHMKAMMIRGLIERDEGWRYRLTEAGRQAFTAILREAGIKA